WPFLVAQAEGIPEFRRVLPTNRSLELVFQLDNRHLLQVADSGWLVVLDTWSGGRVKELPIARTGLSVQTAALSGDGKRIAVAHGRGDRGLVPQPKDMPVAKQPVQPKAMPGVKQPAPPEPEIVIWDIDGKVIRSF